MRGRTISRSTDVGRCTDDGYSGAVHLARNASRRVRGRGLGAVPDRRHDLGLVVPAHGDRPGGVPARAWSPGSGSCSAASALWLIPGVRASIDRADRGRLLLLSITWVVIPFTLFPLAQGSVNSAIAGMLNGAAPIFTAVIATILLRRPPGSRQLIGIPLGFLGVAAIALSAAGQGPSQVVGVVLILIATICYGIAFNVATPLQQRYGSLPVMARILAIGAVLTAPLGLLSIPGSRFAWSALPRPGPSASSGPAWPSC